MIRVDNLVKEFGPRRAVDGVSFSVEPGTVLGFLGPNGAGKTTTIRMIAGFLKPTQGQILVNNINMLQDPIMAQRQVGYMPERTPLYDEMTVEAFLRFVAALRGYQGSERQGRVDQVLRSCFLEPVRHQVIETLSKGYRQRTCLAQAILHDPSVLLLDEPTEGLDPNQKKVVRDMIIEMGKKKVIMISTHVLEEVEAICSRVIIISRGRVVADNPPAELTRDGTRLEEFFRRITTTEDTNAGGL
ncbi:MAG TPA: ATP-binding cassette domain-containing protein [Kiritimatiellia bacterium]|nr:ATP-binding cassette domain-containing protein [Kiritimatiellia bacterium]HMO99384.1 ATP-binding cassette domain-containing protein [Kiritimatiellia bacterium]HMP96506.1 ATP-binding cassette domain-containing protein [Kiritimatiellia bacterium]